MLQHLLIRNLLFLQFGAAYFSLSSKSSEEDIFKEESLQCGPGRFWSFFRERCQPCSECGPRLYVKKECTNNRDTVCDYCFAAFPFRNHNFEEKCIPLFAEKTFEEERDLNMRIGVKVAQWKQPEHLFWNFDDGSHENIRKPPQNTYHSQPEISYVELAICAVTAVLLLAAVALAIFEVVNHLMKRAERRCFFKAVRAVPTLSDEQNEAVAKSAKELERIIGKKGYELLQNAEFV